VGTLDRCPQHAVEALRLGTPGPHPRDRHHLSNRKPAIPLERMKHRLRNQHLARSRKPALPATLAAAVEPKTSRPALGHDPPRSFVRSPYLRKALPPTLSGTPHLARQHNRKPFQGEVAHDLSRSIHRAPGILQKAAHITAQKLALGVHPNAVTHQSLDLRLELASQSFNHRFEFNVVLGLLAGTRTS